MGICSVAPMLGRPFSVPATYWCCVLGAQSKFLMGWVVEQQKPLKASTAESFASIRSFLKVR